MTENRLANTKICDKCKKEYSKTDHSFSVKMFEINNPLSKSKITEYSKFDLCKKCASRMMNWAVSNWGEGRTPGANSYL